MENIVRLNQAQILLLAERLTYADLHGQTVRICTGTGIYDGEPQTWIKWTDSGGCWTAPYYGLDY